MPKKDRTFTSCDVIRIIFRHLDEEELFEVARIMNVYNDLQQIGEDIGFIDELIEFMLDVIDLAQDSLESGLGRIFKEQERRYRELSAGQKTVVRFIDACKYKTDIDIREAFDLI